MAVLPVSEPLPEAHTRAKDEVVPGSLVVDVVVVGSGPAGLVAALAARDADPGVRVAVVTAERLREAAERLSGSFGDEWLAAWADADAQAEAGRQWADASPQIGREIATAAAAGAWPIVRRLEGWGVELTRRSPTPQPVGDGAPDWVTGVSAGPRTAARIHRVLAERVAADPRITVFDRHVVHTLLRAPVGPGAGTESAPPGAGAGDGSEVGPAAPVEPRPTRSAGDDDDAPIEWDTAVWHPALADGGGTAPEQPTAAVPGPRLGSCIGVVAADLDGRREEIIPARCTIIAGGPLHAATGAHDGATIVAAAARAGCSLVAPHTAAWRCADLAGIALPAGIFLALPRVISVDDVGKPLSELPLDADALRSLAASPVLTGAVDGARRLLLSALLRARDGAAAVALDLTANPAGVDAPRTPGHRLRDDLPEVAGLLPEALVHAPRIPLTAAPVETIAGIAVHGIAGQTTVPGLFATGSAIAGVVRDAAPGLGLCAALTSAAAAGTAAAKARRAAPALPRPDQLPARLRSPGFAADDVRAEVVAARAAGLTTGDEHEPSLGDLALILQEAHEREALSALALRPRALIRADRMLVHRAMLAGAAVREAAVPVNLRLFGDKWVVAPDGAGNGSV
jgi:aspartate oxidase